MTAPPRRAWIAAGGLLGLALAGFLHFAVHQPAAARYALLVTLVAGGTPLVGTTALGLLRGRFAADVVAALAITGALLLGHYLAGVIIVLMQAGGEALDAYAMARASDSLEALLARAPTMARRRAAGVITDVPVALVVVGDTLVIRPGDLVPVDCAVVDGHSSVDASALTGEPAPVAARPGTDLLSGALNLDGALTVRATRPASQSQYQQIVRLVESARAEKAPIQRLADRWAVWFTPLTLAMCAVAWAVDGDPTSVLSVLVVATPCPLILATPVAVIAGIGRAAQRGIIVRHGAAIEEAGRVRTVVFDKTGTLTLGRPEVASVAPTDGLDADTVLRLAAAVEQYSSHHIGQALTRAGLERFGALPDVAGFLESPGSGVAGKVEGHFIEVGMRRWVSCAGGDAAASDASATDAWVCVDGRPAGRITFADRIRAGVPELIRQLPALGVRRAVMLTGDRTDAAEHVARLAGITEVRADLLPGDKVEAVGDLRRTDAHVMMVGDGINDAPALAAASVGVAMGAHAPAAAAQAADIVLLVDEIGRVAETVAIGRRTRRIALQSIGVGLGVSAALMVAAAFGHIPPTAGALAQEALDVAVILNALRAR